MFCAHTVSFKTIISSFIFFLGRRSSIEQFNSSIRNLQPEVGYVYVTITNSLGKSPKEHLWFSKINN